MSSGWKFFEFVAKTQFLYPWQRNKKGRKNQVRAWNKQTKQMWKLFWEQDLRRLSRPLLSTAPPPRYFTGSSTQRFRWEGRGRGRWAGQGRGRWAGQGTPLLVYQGGVQNKGVYRRIWGRGDQSCGFHPPQTSWLFFFSFVLLLYIYPPSFTNSCRLSLLLFYLYSSVFYFVLLYLSCLHSSFIIILPS